MEIDLLKIYEENKKIEDLQEEINFKRELRNLISAIIKNYDDYETENKKLVEELKIKYKERKKYQSTIFGVNSRKVKEYAIKLTKENIKKINEYINKEESK